MEKSVKPLLLTAPVNRTDLEARFETPYYRGDYHIGIMRQNCNRRVIWRFVYRGDGRPLFRTWYDEVRHFSHGYAAVRHGAKWHFITPEGKIACRHRFLEVGSVDRNGQVSVVHHTYLDLRTRLPRWVIYTMPTSEMNRA